MTRKKHHEKNKQSYRLCAIIKELMEINEFNGDDSFIRTDLLKEKFSKLNSTRHIQCWHINNLYGAAIHLTDKEYKQIYGKEINVQSVIEKPYLYILAKCPGDNHQLMYADCRNEDIRQLTDDFNGIKNYRYCTFLPR